MRMIRSRLSKILLSLSVILGLCLGQQSATLAASSKNGTTKSWNWQQGWHGIIIGQTPLKDAVAQLGSGKLISEDRPGSMRIYQFEKGVEISSFGDNEPIQLLRVTAAAAPDSQFPLDIKAAKAKYWGWKGAAWGVRTKFSAGAHPQLESLEFYPCKIIDDTPNVRSCRFN